MSETAKRRGDQLDALGETIDNVAQSGAPQIRCA